MSRRTTQVSGGGVAVEVEPEGLERWFVRFAERNDGVRDTRLSSDEVVVAGRSGVTATAVVPFPPLAETGTRDGLDVGPLIAHAARPRRVGLLLVRRGAHSVGVAENGRVVVSRTDRHHLQGRSAAGGTSQGRFARRRANQARQALRSATNDAAEVLGTRTSELDAVVLGGDRGALDTVRVDSRLADVFALAGRRVLDVGEPRRAVLDEAAQRSRAVVIVVR